MRPGTHTGRRSVNDTGEEGEGNGFVSGNAGGARTSYITHAGGPQNMGWGGDPPGGGVRLFDVVLHTPA